MNSSDNATACAMQPQNPWCGLFGPQQIFEIVYLSIISLVGSVGNLIVIFSIIFEKRVNKHGNLFIINLAAADFIVSGVFIPTMIANVAATGNALPDRACHVVGFVLILTAVCSVANLMFIALSRYWAVVHVESYARYFSNGKIVGMVVFIWGWSFLLCSPTLYGWSRLTFDYRMMGCAWDDQASPSYNVIFMACSNFLPVSVITFCYWNLFRNVRKRGKWLRNLAATPNGAVDQEKVRICVEREIHLLRTLATSVLVFVLCWVPYVFCIIINPSVHHQAKKVFGWLGMTNSAINFIIYGLLNPVYREGYKNFLNFLLCCYKQRSCVRSPSDRHILPTKSCALLEQNAVASQLAKVEPLAPNTAMT